MFFQRNSIIARFVTSLAVLFGLLGMAPVHPAHAATLTVSTLNDSGPGSLCQAIADAVSGDVITFNSSLAGGGIGLNSQLSITKNLTIAGSGLNPPIVLSGGAATRIMQVDYPAQVTISGLILQNGFATSGNGGAVYNTGEFTAIDSSFLYNAGWDGGAIWGGTIKVRNSTFSGNHAYGSGGAIIGVNLDIRNTTFHGNQANQDGGAISIYGDGTSTIVNSTIFRNQAGNSGGGLFITGYPLVDIFNSTLAENFAVNGHEFILGTIYHIAFANTIFVCNAASTDCYVPSGNSIANTNTILGIGTLSDYGLAELGDNGGFTQTMALLPNSPLLDSGEDTICANAPVNNLDQRGVTRPQGSHCDIGAYEYQETTAPTVLSITRAATTPTSGSSVDFTVTFSEAVIGVDTNDFVPYTTGNVTGAAISNVSGSGSLYTVTVNTGSGNGILRLDVPVTAGITDIHTNSLAGLPFTAGEMYTLLKIASFLDVENAYWAWSFIERLYLSGITSGCSTNPAQYCPEATVTRAQMAVFLERGIHDSSYSPPAVGSSTGFGDVPVDYWSAAWIKQLAADGITSGCGNGNYCPEDAVTRAQMAVFLLRSKYDASYTPPDVGAGTSFEDVSPTYWAAAWIKQLVNEGITAGCGNNNYCPEQPVTRAQMAVFLVRTFNLP
jgi:predicted outer membrane repeat protein